jgi:cytochrome c nitrite reductase small subunit
MSASKWAFWLLCGWAGALAGVGGATFHYAKGTSYLSSDPAVCVNCHIMRPQYDAWLKSSHEAVAGCVDCHLPADFLGKYTAKVVNGWNHSKAFTLQDFPEPILITPRNAEMLDANCRRCHAALVHDLQDERAGPHAFPCVHCHASVGHGEAVGLGGPWPADESKETSDE